jgi:hypothetical protein
MIIAIIVAFIVGFIIGRGSGVQDGIARAKRVLEDEGIDTDDIRF